MVDGLESLSALITVDVNTMLRFDEAKARRVFEKLNAIWKEKIGSGSVLPALKARTIALKRKLGYSNPTAPLFATGNLLDSLELAEFTDSVLLIASNANVDPSWHMNELDSRRAIGVPRRDPFEGVDLEGIIISVLEEDEKSNA